MFLHTKHNNKIISGLSSLGGYQFDSKNWDLCKYVLEKKQIWTCGSHSLSNNQHMKQTLKYCIIERCMGVL